MRESIIIEIILLIIPPSTTHCHVKRITLFSMLASHTYLGLKFMINYP
jgi:hypothetical protein